MPVSRPSTTSSNASRERASVTSSTPSNGSLDLEPVEDSATSSLNSEYDFGLGWSNAVAMPASTRDGRHSGFLVVMLEVESSHMLQA